MKIKLLSFTFALVYPAMLATVAVIVTSYPEGILADFFKDESESIYAFQLFNFGVPCHV